MKLSRKGISAVDWLLWTTVIGIASVIATPLIGYSYKVHHGDKNKVYNAYQYLPDGSVLKWEQVNISATGCNINSVTLYRDGHEHVTISAPYRLQRIYNVEK